MTEGVWAMAPIMLQTHMTHRKVRKASWQPGLGHLPGTTVAFSGGPVVRHAQPVRFWKEEASGPAQRAPGAPTSQADHQQELSQPHDASRRIPLIRPEQMS